jgi:Putative transposase/Transposase zinc-binding domain
MVDLGEIMRGEGAHYLNNSRFSTPVQRKAIRDIAGCRTLVMGAVLTACQDCSVEFWRYRSCGNRSCPFCQGEARSNWFAARLEELLPVSYLHAVFNVPSEFRVLARYCPKELYDAVIRAVGQAIIDVGWSELHALLGCLIQLQTWTQTLAYLLHAHCVIPCGGFSEDGSRWISFEPGDLPASALSARFRTLLCKAIRTAAREGKFERLPKDISVDQILLSVRARDWKVYAEPPFGGPEQLLVYLAQFTNRVAITNDRIESYENRKVTFRSRDYRHGEVKSHKLEGAEFVHRFVQHVPPKGFVRIRSYGFMANRNRKKNLERARQLIGKSVAPSPREAGQADPARSSHADATLSGVL